MESAAFVIPPHQLMRHLGLIHSIINIRLESKNWERIDRNPTDSNGFH